MNRGDSFYIKLEITIDGHFIEEGFADEIELTLNPQEIFNCVQKTLTNEEIYWDDSQNAYVCFLNQEDTFKLFAGNNSYQIRVLQGNEVISTNFGILRLGDVNSKEILI